MSEKRVQFNKIVKNQLPSYVKDEFPLIGEFLSQYYLGQEFQGAPIDLIQNIDSYIKLNECGNAVASTTLSENVDFAANNIFVENTSGFPENYGLIKINDEIITYTSKTDVSFVDCVRGFSGITSFTNPDNPEDLVFSSSQISTHNQGTTVENLSGLFLQEFLKKVKKQFLPGFQKKVLDEDLNQSQFIRNSKDFYSTRGTDASFKILFKSLYGEDVEIVRPSDYVISSSNAIFRRTKDLIVESISGDPFDLINRTLFQDEFENISKAYAPVSNVEKISVGILTDVYYKVSIDGSYINKEGTNTELLYDNFSVHAKTKVVGDVGVGQTYLNVDSTVGFPNSGTITVIYNDSTIGIVTYSERTINQFLNVFGIEKLVLDTTDIDQNTFAYSSGIGRTDGIQIKIRSILKDLNVPQDTYGHLAGSRIKIKSFGKVGTEPKQNNWIFNNSQTYQVESLELIDSRNFVYKIITKDENILRVGDRLKLKNLNQEFFDREFIVTNIFNNKTCLTRGFNIGDPSQIASVRRILSNVNSEIHPYLNIVTSNVQNVYLDNTEVLVASNSLPSFDGPINPKTQKIIFSGTFQNQSEELKITDTVDHNFFTGDAIYYTPEKNESGTILSYLFDEGLYFVKRIDQNTIKLAKSPSNIFKGIFVYPDISADQEINIANNTIEKYNFKDTIIEPQKILRKISNPIRNNEKKYETNPGNTGVLINGVEILNYKSNDLVYHGQLEKVEVVSGGKDYDVINPPTLSITDEIGIGVTVGTGATGFCSVKGEFKEIRVLNSGFDYLDKPIIKISGGNGNSAVAEPSMSLIAHELFFDSTGSSGIGSVGIGTDLSRIGFSTYHKFRDGESVKYRTFGKRSLSGLTTDAIYYVKSFDNYVVKLHKTEQDARLGINTVYFNDYGIGNHSLVSLSGKLILSSVKIINPGIDYENKKRSCSPSGINTSLGIINIENHDYKNGEIIEYSFDGESISGLSTSLQYYVTVVDQNSFKLSDVGIGSTSVDFFLKTNQFKKLSSVGVGTHLFNYPEIKVEVVGRVGISSIDGNTFNAVVQPIVRGEITSVHLDKKGTNYGTSEILNFERNPNIVISSGIDADLLPIISQGRIVDVIINNSGSNYISPPKLNVIGEGTSAVLTPQIVNGRIISVTINQSGIGYGTSTTSIQVVSAGSGVEFKSKIQTWRVNNFRKNLTNISEDDLFIEKSKNENYGLQCFFTYAPRNLRKTIYSTDRGGRIVYGKTDLRISNNLEIDNVNHSPIIGWAYDGHPIYGPYGYTRKTGGTVTQLKSGYTLDLKSNRPSLVEFPAEFFVEDFTWINSTDEDVLDENNGRFCVTPEFPNGTYAYFATFDYSPSSDGVFKNFKKPIFPYLIGNHYNSTPIEFNFKKDSNQDVIDLNKTNWSRNTYSYLLGNENSEYEYLKESYKFTNQDSIIKFAEKGSINFVGIISGGTKYQVSDNIIFNSDITSSGANVGARVSKVGGVGITSINVESIKLNNLEFYPHTIDSVIAIHTGPHEFENFDIVYISGLSTTSYLRQGSYPVGVVTNSFNLFSPIGTTGSTGIVTYLYLAGNVSESIIRENDILKFEDNLGGERVKVLNIDQSSSRIRALRSYDNTEGNSKPAGSFISELPRKLYLNISNVGYQTFYDIKRTKEYYFHPAESIGLGSDSSLGIGVTISFSNPGVGFTQIFVPTRGVYLPNHNLLTGDEVVYNVNYGSTIGVSTVSGGSSVPLSNNSILYVAKINNDIIGLSTVKVGIGTTGTFVGAAASTSHQGLLYFVGLGTGEFHSFKVTYPNIITGSLERNLVTVSTSSTHGLKYNDPVTVSINPKTNKTIKVKYNLSNRKLLLEEYQYTSSGISSDQNTITISNHNLLSGQKVINELTTDVGSGEEFKSDKEYFVYVIDENTIKLTTDKFSISQKKPNFVGLSTISGGSLSLVNPPLTLYKDSTIIFDLSDSSLSYVQGNASYSAFYLEFFRDSNFEEKYETNGNSNSFNVTSEGDVGISANAKTTIVINEDTPPFLYYKLTPLNQKDNPKENREIVIDDEVDFNNQLIIRNSLYSGNHFVRRLTPTSFSYPVNTKDEITSYNSSQSQLSYITSSETAYGPISEVSVLNRGKNYLEIPGISTISSDIGTGAILQAFSDTIGKIRSVKIENIGFDYPSDLTLRPDGYLPQILKIDQLASFESIGITSFGKFYTTPPKLIVIDGIANNVIDDVKLDFDPQKDENFVRILQNTFSLSDTAPRIIPIENSSGIGITNITFNPATKYVTAEFIRFGQFFASFFSDVVQSGDKVLIENVNVGLGTTATGYNSSDYNYALFDVVGYGATVLDNAIVGIVTYSMSEYLSDGDYPGNIVDSNRSSRLVPESFFPKFVSTLKKTGFRKSDTITNGNSSGTVFEFNPESKVLHIESSDNFEIGDIIISNDTGARGLVREKIFFNSKYNLGYYSVVDNGWARDTGFLNDELQRIHDNDYYQYFSYAVKSKVTFDEWNDIVSTLNHASGFKKFSDLQLESTLTTSLIPSTDPITTIFVELDNVYDLNCYPNFDLVHENYLRAEDGSGRQYAFSDEINLTTKIVKDYNQSISNRVLRIDDISGEFNSNPRPTPFSDIFRQSLDESQAQKFICYVKDRTFIGERQLIISTVLTDRDRELGMINQYGKVESVLDLGSLDYIVDGNDGVLRFYPNKYEFNNYNLSFFSYSINDFNNDLINLSETGSQTIGVSSEYPGSLASIASSEVSIPGGSPSTILRLVGIGTTIANTRSAKVLINLEGDDGRLEFNELNIIHDGNEVHLLEYGQLSIHSIDAYSSVGMGTYWSYLSGSDLLVTFTPEVGLSTVKVSTIAVGLSTENYNNQNTSIGSTFSMTNGDLIVKSKNILSGSSDWVANFSSDFDAAYSIIQISDLTNQRYQLSEVVLVSDGTDVYLTEFGNIETDSPLGSISGSIDGNGTAQIDFTPISGIDVHTKSFTHAFKVETVDTNTSLIDLSNSSIKSNFSIYTGTEIDVRRNFDLKYKTYPIFKRVFDGSDTTVVDLTKNKVFIPNHFFVTGEEVSYAPRTGVGTNSVGIATTSIVGIGSTNKLPSNVYIIKLSESEVSIGQSHSLISKNQNQRVLLSIDNLIQSPIVATSITTTLSENVLLTQDTVKFSGITSFFSGDYIKINNEIMRISGVGIGSTNAISVTRAWAGTSLAEHSFDSLVTKIQGNYNITDNTVNFIEAPFGNNPLSSTSNPPSSRDWVGITTSSSFSGRVFMKSGIVGGSTEPYADNYLYDDVSQNFSGSKSTYTLTSGKSNVAGISTNNAIVLINGILQGPGMNYDYTLNENIGITSITFTGTPNASASDPNSLNVPVGGIIVSVASSYGFGYQPLISAGGTSVVSSAGTIESVSVGNSGSGYRGKDFYELETLTSHPTSIGSTTILLENQNSVFQILSLLNAGNNCSIGVGSYINLSTPIVSVGATFITVGIGSTVPYLIPSGTNANIKINNPAIGIVNVSVATSSLGITTETHVGFTTIVFGNISSPIIITNGSVGFTSENPPQVIIEDPISYSSIPLVYSEYSVGTGGTQAKDDIVVGQGSSVIDFEIKNSGFGYGIGHILTLPRGGVTGIPTDPNKSLEEFSLIIQETETDAFAAWSIGQLEPLDDFSNLFDGFRKTFPITLSGEPLSIQADFGSLVKVEDCVIILINDILQVPGEAYILRGGSSITFTEAPKSGDSLKFLFYKGTKDVDVLRKEVIDLIQPGDTLTIDYDRRLQQSDYLQQDTRSVFEVKSSNSIKTNVYYNPGLLEDSTIYRPVTLCKQVEDKFIDGTLYTKDRELYEPSIFPVSYLIQSVGVGSTVIYVDNIRPFFNPINENNLSLDFQKNISVVSQDTVIAAAATALVGNDGNISGFVISDGGVGYTTCSITISNPIGIGTTRATAIPIISIGGTVSEIQIVNQSGVAYTNTNPPQVLISPPALVTENIQVHSFNGDFGIVVGLGVTSVGVASTGITFDLLIPTDSVLRNSSITGVTTISGLQTNDYFVIYNSNVGNGVTSLNELNQTIGIGTSFLDNVYKVVGVSTLSNYQTVGYGTTSIVRVIVSVSDYNGLNVTGIRTDFYGNYSWGKLVTFERDNTNTYNARVNSGVVGIATGSLVKRQNSLKFHDYSS